MVGYGNSGEFLRQLSGGGRGGWDYCSSYNDKDSAEGRGSGNWRRRSSSAGAGGDGGWRGMEEGDAAAAKKRVMVVVDRTVRAKQAMMWALTHVANKGDLLTVLHVIPGSGGRDRAGAAPELAVTLGTLCKACRPEVEVEALAIQGPRLSTVLSQVRKLEASVLVLGQSKPSPFCCFFRSGGEGFVEDCINRADCLTVAVRKQSKGVGGYLVSTKWQKNFWLLA